MTEHEYQFDVKMACDACSGAIERVLSRMEGVSSYEVSLPKQTVTVKGAAPYEAVLEKIKKTGKEVLSGRVVA
ncbi:Cytosolic copper metallochaperone [Malassezia sp. CBS 17886]|nr:Cytosolic copper metallochaperone [Malassezia sp. CBS 17886]